MSRLSRIHFLNTSMVAIIFAVHLGSARLAYSDDSVPQFSLPALTEFWAIVERPLLAPSRRPSDVTAEATDPAASGEDSTDAPAQVMLVGTATDQRTRAVAILRNSANATEFRVWVGDTVGAWHVKAIRPRAITLGTADVEVSVTLDEPIVPDAPEQP